MKRDTIFYTFFQRSPTVLFDLIPNPPSNPEGYRFDSVAVKEPKFEIDGVFLPPKGTIGTVYFCEVQMQPDQLLYERIFAEIAQYFYRNRARFSDWQVIVIYPTRSIEQKNVHPYRIALASEQFHRIYLDELGDIDQLPLRVGLMVLTTIQEKSVVAAAKKLITKAQTEAPPEESRAIIEMVATIIWYKFEQLSQREIEAMLDIPVKETKLYKEGIKEGQRKGIQKGELTVILRLLHKRLGDIPQDVVDRVSTLSLVQLESLSDTFLDFATVMDLQTWLDQTLLPQP